MKKKIIILAVAIVFVAAIVIFCSTFRISMSFDESGSMTSEGTFTISFQGSDQYTDKELAGYLFETELQTNPFLFLWNNKFGDHVEIPFIEEYDVETDGLTHFNVTFYEKSIVGYVEYMGSYKYFDKDCIVVESSETLLEGVPYVTGISVDYIVLHSKLPVDDDKIFDVLLDVTQLVTKYNISVDRINISKDMEIKLYLGDVRVDMGKPDNLGEKFMDLNDIIPNMGDVKGVLDMQEYNEQGEYTLKKEK